MNRRQFVSNVAGTLTVAAIGAGAEPPPAQPDHSARRVLIMFKCHFDCGFIDTQAAVVRKYFEHYYPEAIRVAAAAKQNGSDRYVWTTGSWLLYEYLEQASAAERKRMEDAIQAGHIAWHALPFSWQTELLDPSAIAACIGFSKSLDRRFGRTTTGAKMTDVPGHSRGLVAPLAESGVKLLDIGVNSASTPPDVPAAFLWRDPNNHSLIMLYHRRAYGGVIRIPSSDLAIAVEVRGDNSGPHTAEEIQRIYASLRLQFPNASVQAANLTEIANTVEPFRDKLPVVTSEIGDTWIYGIASDPVKVARYRELLRLRREWIKTGQLQAGGPQDLAFLRRFSLAAEHTWGTDTKTWLDFDHYTPHALAEMLDQPHYRVVTGSWAEKRNDIDEGVAALSSALRAQAETQLSSLKPVAPDLSQLRPFAASTALETPHFTIGLDPATGAITRLRSKAQGREWASAKHPLGLFCYQTLSKPDYDRFLASYITVKTDWAPKDFGKPNIETFGAQSRTWSPRMVECLSGETQHAHRIVAKLQINEPTTELTAWPSQLYLELNLPDDEPVIQLAFTWTGKRANRLPEALWLTFQPDAPNERNWTMTKVEQPLSPFEVVTGGNRHMHALSEGIRYEDSSGKFGIETLDAPLVALGERSPIFFSNAQPEFAKGLHFSLFNNGWGTNYIQWFSEDMRFRFTIRA